MLLCVGCKCKGNSVNYLPVGLLLWIFDSDLNLLQFLYLFCAALFGFIVVLCYALRGLCGYKGKLALYVAYIGGSGMNVS